MTYFNHSTLGVDISRAKKEDAGPILADKVRSILSELEFPNGLNEMGYTTDDIPTMVAGAMPQVVYENFLSIFFYILRIFAQNIDCGYTLEPPRGAPTIFVLDQKLEICISTFTPAHSHPSFTMKNGVKGYSFHDEIV